MIAMMITGLSGSSSAAGRGRRRTHARALIGSTVYTEAATATPLPTTANLQKERPPAMARYTKVTLTDDLDGGVAEETVTFALDGQDYEIDLSTENTEQLRRVLAPFIAKARTTGRAAGRTRRQRGTDARRNASEATKPAGPDHARPVTDVTLPPPQPHVEAEVAGPTTEGQQPAPTAARFSNPTAEAAEPAATSVAPAPSAVFSHRAQ